MKQVYHAVFDRSISKLVEILLMDNIESFKYRDAIITLNEMVDHQEMKDQMITAGIILNKCKGLLGQLVLTFIIKIYKSGNKLYSYWDVQ